MNGNSEDLNQQIDSLRQSVANIEVLAAKARVSGDYARAQVLSGQAVDLSARLGELHQQRRGQAIDTAAWGELSARLDTLVDETKKTEGEMRTAQQNVETVKSLVSLVGKLASL